MEQTKSFNKNGGKNRLRFATSKSRAKTASADIYRAHIGRHSINSTSSTADREKRVHDGNAPSSHDNATRQNKRLKSGGSDNSDNVTVRCFERENDADGFGMIGRSAVIVTSQKQPLDGDADSTASVIRAGYDVKEEDEDHQIFLTGGTELLSEIEISSQRNGSQQFHKFIGQLRPLCKSFAELLHNKEKIVDLMCANLLSADERDGGEHTVNIATHDILHLLGVLARELRGELYPLLKSKIFPRIIDDMLNPSMSVDEKNQQQKAPLDVAHVESAFRCLSYLFKYNSDELISNGHEVDGEKTAGDADSLRQHYGKTVCHRRDIVRKLASEAYAPLLRKCTEKGLKRHLTKTIKALATSLTNAQNESQNHVSNSMKRARMDAIDGVSLLLFEVARGAKRVHSKTGKVVIRSLVDCLMGYNDVQNKADIKTLTSETRKAQVVYEVASLCLYKLRGHIVKGTPMGESIDPSIFGGVFDEIYKALDKSISAVKENKSMSTANTAIVGHIVDLVTEMVNFQDGRLIRDASIKKGDNDRISRLLQSLLSDNFYSKADKNLQHQILQLMCSTWKTNPDHPSFSQRLGKYFHRILAPTDSQKDDYDLNPAIYLAKHLLPFLPQKVASSTLIPSLLRAAASSSIANQDHCDDALVLLHAVSTTSWSSDIDECEMDPDDFAADSFFSTKAAELLPVVSNDITRVLVETVCLRDDIKNDTSNNISWIERVSRVGYVVRCIPFLVCLCCSSDDSDCEEQQDEPSPSSDLAKVLNWYASVMKHLSANHKNNVENVHIVMALVLESYTKVATVCYSRVPQLQSVLRKTTTKIKGQANSLLFAAHPRSCWVMKGLAAFVSTLSLIDPGAQLNDKPNDTFELLATNLSQPDHFMRLYTLQILDNYPRRPFVTNHADLDLTDDLEEGPASRTDATMETDDKAMGTTSLGGPCDLISVMKTLESIPVAFKNERKLTSQISRVEVYANTGKLPALYAESAICHMLGLLNVKFAPIWPAAARAIVALTISNEDITWPHLYSALQKSLQKHVSENSSDLITHQETHLTSIEAILNHHKRCVAWEQSKGMIDIFTPYNSLERQTVSRHTRADEFTLFQNIWGGIMADAQQVTSTKSRLIVPLFLEFMIDQYYTFHSDDPDMCEIGLPGIVESRVKWNREELGKKSVQRKLESFLRMFAAVNGPQQLFKHRILLQMFIGFLSNPDPKLANLSLKCVMKFKLPFAMPYIDSIQAMLKKDELRDALAKFSLSTDSDSVDAEHRLLLIPIVTRILFGRLQSRGNKSKTSRDSPAARRAAILSFFSRMGNSKGELTYFIYMMVRAFIPSEYKQELDPTNTSLADSIESLNSIDSEVIERIPLPRQVGFLNLLSDVINQIGYGVVDSVPVFLNLLLTMSKVAQDALVESNEIQLSNMQTEADDEGSGELEKDGSQTGGRIRTLIFLRLGDLLTKFASSSINFTVYGDQIWNAVSFSLLALPNTVINAEKPPSLLRLIESISTQPKLISLLQRSNDVIPSVFRCIAGTTRFRVMDSVLHIIDNLLNNADVATNITSSNPPVSLGQAMVLKHIHLLISQFDERLTSKITKSDTGADVKDYSENGQRFNSSEGLQLSILCRISELLLKDSTTSNEHMHTLESLCGLLVPSLNFSSHPNQIHLMRTVANFLPRLSAASAKKHYHALSKLLGPNKSNPGISSSELRQVIAAALCAIGNSSSDLEVITEFVRDLNAFSTSHIDEYDFESMLPVLNKLGGSSSSEGSWLDLSLKSNDVSGDPRALFPLFYSCLHMIHSTDAVIGRAASKAIKMLITTCSDQLEGKSRDELAKNRWMQFIEKSVISCLKTGLTTKADETRRHFVLLMAHVARNFSCYDSPHLYGDLHKLIRDDDQDLDFFLNMTHLQLHRRVKALQRLRKMITATDETPLFSEQSYANVLLPLAVHPVYECTSKSEDLLAIEAITTVGVISSRLLWGKYHEALQSVLNSLTRHPEKERHLIALVCSMIDAFHFTVVEAEGTGSFSNGNGVWRSLQKRIIPKVESFLTKEKIDRRGIKSKCIRPSVVLALVKLFQKLPTKIFEAKLPQLIKIISTTLRNKDSNEREVARDTMAKIASSLDMKYLPLILSDLSITLSHGYQLHVRAATLHSILVAISSVYQPATVSSIDEAFLVPFDRCVRAMLDLIQQDIFGTSSEMKEADHVGKRLIKEAMGSKSQDSLEIISRLILFKPSIAMNEESRSKSSAHLVVKPFIQRLVDPEVLPSTIRKVKECLNKIAVGLSNNPSADIKEILPFIYATVAPFVLGEVKRGPYFDDEVGNSDEEADAPLQVTKTNGIENKTKKAKGVVVKVSHWAPSTLDALESQRSALEMKRTQKRNLHKVTDGPAAPKLTGSSRHNPMKSTAKLLNNPANASALIFGLTLLNSCLKKYKLDASDETICAMTDPYLNLLVQYVKFSQDSIGITLSLRCLGFLLRIDLPSVPKIATKLSPIVLEHLTAWGAASNTQTEIVQGCFRTLNLLFSHPSLSSPNDSTEKSNNLPLVDHQMQALISLLQAAVMESEHHSATFGLVKAICSKKYISPEFYDLIDIILKLSVQSQKPAVRLQSSQIFLQYLLDYPMGTQRLDTHLQQVVLNLKYEYEEGRLSAIDLLHSVIQKLPIPVLEKHSQLFFLPLVLQLANDDSKRCKKQVTGAISLLLGRLSTGLVQSFFSYVSRWSQSAGDEGLPMRQAAAQLSGIFLESRPDFIKRGTTSFDMMRSVSLVLQEFIPFDSDNGWELLYYNVLCVEKLNKNYLPAILAHSDIGVSLINLLAYPHPWVMQASLRIINNHVGNIDPKSLVTQGADSYLIKNEGCLYDISRNLCRLLDVDDAHFVDAISVLAIKTITWLFQLMNHHPDLFYTASTDNEVNGSNEDQSKNPCRWIMSRLSNIAKPKRGAKRRESIFKCYAALCASCEPEQLNPYLRLMITSLDRVIREETNNLQSEEQQTTHPLIAFPKDVLNLLEDACGTDKFLKAYSEVNKKVRGKKDQRKQEIAAEAVHNPTFAAKRKIKKQLHERERKKRRVDEMKLMRGTTKKNKY